MHCAGNSNSRLTLLKNERWFRHCIPCSFLPSHSLSVRAKNSPFDWYLFLIGSANSANQSFLFLLPCVAVVDSGSKNFFIQLLNEGYSLRWITLCNFPRFRRFFMKSQWAKCEQGVNRTYIGYYFWKRNRKWSPSREFNKIFSSIKTSTIIFRLRG